jgi:hypothetical protein
MLRLRDDYVISHNYHQCYCNMSERILYVNLDSDEGGDACAINTVALT